MPGTGADKLGPIAEKPVDNIGRLHRGGDACGWDRRDVRSTTESVGTMIACATLHSDEWALKGITMATKLRLEDYPETRENWAEAVFEGRAKCTIATKSGHTLVSDEAPGFAGGAGGDNAGPTPSGMLVAAFAADIPVMLARIASELGLDIAAMRAKVSIEFSPRGIAGFAGYEPRMSVATSDIWITTAGDPATIEEMQAHYLRRCPLYALFKNSGCRMVERWHIERR